MSLDEESLETVANSGLMDYEKWPSMVDPLIERLEHNVYNAFPMPKFPPGVPSIAQQTPSSFPPASYSQEHNTVPSSSNKENTPPTEIETPSQPTLATSAASPPPSSERVPDSQPQSFTRPTNDTLPAPLVLLLDSIKSTLKTFFASKPPHTLQRLAELIIRPNAHYRTLPAYLRAVDRVVSVTSTADIFPLQTEADTSQTNGIMNGGGSSFMLPDLGSDESLGGALLTPIPWLTGASSPGNEGGAPLSEGSAHLITTRISTLTMDSFTGLVPGDTVCLISQPSQPEQVPAQVEERETVPQPAAQHAQSTAPTAENEPSSGTGFPQDISEEIPHARGPPVVGVEDMGLQDGKGVELTLSNNGDALEHPDQEASAATQGQSDSKPASRVEKDSDGDILLEDAQGAGETTPAAGEDGQG